VSRYAFFASSLAAETKDGHHGTTANVALRCLLIVALLLAYPALRTAIGLLRAHRVLGKLYWHVSTGDNPRRP
jgi:hypothetical protein